MVSPSIFFADDFSKTKSSSSLPECAFCSILTEKLILVIIFFFKKIKTDKKFHKPVDADDFDDNPVSKM